MLSTTQFAYRKGLGTCDANLYVSHYLQVHWSVGRRLGLFRSTSVPLLKWSPTRNSLQALLCGHWRFWDVSSDSFCSIGNSTSWWMVVGVIWLTSYRECLREVFCPAIVPDIHRGAFLYILLSKQQGV